MPNHFKGSYLYDLCRCRITFTYYIGAKMTNEVLDYVLAVLIGLILTGLALNWLDIL